MCSFNGPRKRQSAGQATGQAEYAAAVVNQAKVLYSAYLIVVLLVFVAFGLYELLCLVEPFSGVWSKYQAKLSEMSASLSEQASELSRLRTLLSEVLTTESGSVSAAKTKQVAQAVGGLYLLGSKLCFVT